MPADLFLRGVDLDLLYPPFLETLLEVLAACRARGADFLVTEGYRSFARSEALYVTFKRGGPRAAPAGASGHNFGLCADLGRIIKPSPKRVLSWNPVDMAVLVEEAKKAGLHAGMMDDLAHVGFKPLVTATQLEPLKKAWLANPLLGDLERLHKCWDIIPSLTP